MGKLVFKNGLTFEGESFGANISSAGEVVFSTGMMGYPESLTDPSYKGQILVLTYPLVGNYGIPDKKFWEADKIMVSGLIVSNYIDTPYHFQSKQSLSDWLVSENIPGLQIKDTRLLTQMIRKKGTLLGKIVLEQDILFYDPDHENLVEKVSTKKINRETYSKSSKNILLIDCGAKRNIQRALLKRKVNVITVPWDFDLTNEELRMRIDAVVISNGPGNPKFVLRTIENIKKLMSLSIPILGVCLGNQLLALASGGDTAKLKYGHRSQNQPCLLFEKGKPTQRCFITTQNHGFEVSKIPPNFYPWFTNANDNSNEGIIHKRKPVMSVQFHPEATPGPEDTEWIFDYFLKHIK
ncbi:MAG: glutamine-hydrolyzing carbamoyl-phosphate synthase small subunit [Candidatus Levybacteria bacterium]|nr:glutamine-hydrolyzing carbamoyl-phosphate synthase small subunit [Candidatus Levybacteria bacterium]